MILSCLVILLEASCTSKEEKLNSHYYYNLVLTEASDSIAIFGEDFISTGLNERDIAISPFGDIIYFTLGNHNDTKRAIIESRWSIMGWSLPKIAKFSGSFNDIEPFIAPNGEKLFFSSNRPIYGDSTRADYNIWYVNKLDDGWGEPIALPQNINTKSDEFYPSVSNTGNLYFTSTRDNGIGKEDIFLSKFIDNQYSNPEPLDSLINTATYEFNAFVSPNEDILIFSSYGRDDDMGGGDLYKSEKDSSGNWQKAVHLGDKINSNKLDYCPFIDFKNNTFYFSSNRVEPDTESEPLTFSEYRERLLRPKNGLGDIYRVNIKEIEL